MDQETASALISVLRQISNQLSAIGVILFILLFTQCG